MRRGSPAGPAIRQCRLPVPQFRGLSAPPLGQVQVYLFAQWPLRADPEAVADGQHPDHQLRVDRWPAGVAVEGREVLAQVAEIEEAVDPAQNSGMRPKQARKARVMGAIILAILTGKRPLTLCWALGYVMKDSEFKSLPHRVGELKIDSCGSCVSVGYKPDVTIIDKNGRLVFILESEQKTDRKAFLGDVLKAEKYAEECRASPMLVIVMQPQPNTKVEKIADHIRPYVAWLKQRLNGGLNLSGVFVISDSEYQTSLNANELLGSEPFMKRGFSIDV